MPVKSYLLACIFLTALTISAQSGEKYSAEDMVKFFTSGAGNGAARGLCVGAGCEPVSTTKQGAGFNLNVNFKKDSALLTEEAQAQLSVAAEAMNSTELAKMKFAVEGYADASGTISHNMVLSERRAKSVVEYLHIRGVDATRLNAAGYGETNSLSDDPYDPLNRRVETRRIVE